MKKIEAVIRPDKLEDVKTALGEAGFMGITVTEVLGAGRQRGFVDGGEKAVAINLLPKTKIEIIVKDEQVMMIKETIQKAAQTGKIGDGNLFVLAVGDDVMRIRTGEVGEAAV